MFDKLKSKWQKASGLEKAAVGAGLTAATGGLAPIVAGGAAIGSGISKFHKDRVRRPGWQRKQMLRKDMQRLQEGPQALGLSESERERMLQEQMEASNAQAQAQQTAIAQQALSGGEFQQDTYAQAQQAAAQAQQTAAAQAQANVEAQNQQRITQEANRIRAEIAQKQAENEAKTKYWTDKGVNLALNIMSMAGGLPGIAAGAGTGSVSTASPARDITEYEVEGVDPDVLDQMSNERW